MKRASYAFKINVCFDMRFQYYDSKYDFAYIYLRINSFHKRNNQSSTHIGSTCCKTLLAYGKILFFCLPLVFVLFKMKGVK